MEDKVCISGRSIGDINVQVILEKLGGGGHITIAGTQIEGMTIEETKQELINRINACKGYYYINGSLTLFLLYLYCHFLIIKK